LNQVPRKLTSSIALFKSSQSGLPMNLLNTPMPRVSCPNDENPENQADQFRAFLHKLQIHHTSFGQLTLGMGVFKRFMGSPDCEDLKMLWRKLIFEVPDSHLFFCVKMP
jgi:hypothetical protein